MLATLSHHKTLRQVFQNYKYTDEDCITEDRKQEALLFWLMSFKLIKKTNYIHVSWEQFKIHTGFSVTVHWSNKQATRKHFLQVRGNGKICNLHFKKCTFTQSQKKLVCHIWIHSHQLNFSDPSPKIWGLFSRLIKINFKFHTKKKIIWMTSN